MNGSDADPSIPRIRRPNRPDSEMERIFLRSPDLLATAHLEDAAWKRVNPAFTRILGWTESQLLARPCLEIVHPEELERSREALADLAEGTPLTQFECRVRCRNGSYRWIAWEVWSDLAEGLMYGTGRDVSDRKRIEKNLQESEARYQALFNNMTEGFAVGEVIFDGKGEPDDFRFIQINDAFSEQTGLGREVLNRPITEVLPEVESHWMEKYGRVALTGEPATFENYNVDTDRYYHVYCYSPEKNRFAILFRDVTEEKRAEQILRESETLYRSLAANLPDGAAFVVNHELRYLLAEGEALRQVGFQSADFEGKRLSEVLGSKTAALYESNYRKALSGRPFAWEHQSHGRHYITRGVPLRDGSGRIFAALAVSYDVTDRKAAEEALRRSEENERSRAAELEALMDAFPAVVFISRDPECRTMVGSRATYELLKVPHEQNVSVSGPPEELPDHFRTMKNGREIPPEDMPMQKAAASGKPVRDYELDVVFRNGERKTILGNAVPLLNETGAPYGAVSAFLDITERKRSEDRLRTTLESIGDGFIACDRDWRLIYINPPAEKMLGIRRDEVLGKHYRDVFPVTRGTVLDREFRRAAAGEIREFETFVDIGGRWFHHRCFPREGGGISAYFRDVTETKRMEAALRSEQELFQTIFTSVPVMMTVYDPLLNMIHINQSLYDITGWTEAEMREHGIMELVYPDPDYRRWVAAYMQSLSPGFQDIRMTCKDGRVLETAWANIRISDGRQVGIGIDMTERKELEEDLRRLNRTLEQRVAERTALAEDRARELDSLTAELIEAEERERRRIADLLHDDLQQVLTGARMQLQTLSNRLSLNEELDSIQQLLADAVQKTRRLSHELSPAVTHQSGLTGALEWLARNMNEQFGLEVRLEAGICPDLENASLRTFIYRAVNELLFNIIKHAGVKTAEVSLSQEDGRLAIRVSDEGDGFDPGIMNSSDAHSGLGLISLRERARHFGGFLEIDSAPGKGSRFSLHIPNTPASVIHP